MQQNNSKIIPISLLTMQSLVPLSVLQEKDFLRGMPIPVLKTAVAPNNSVKVRLKILTKYNRYFDAVVTLKLVDIEGVIQQHAGLAYKYYYRVITIKTWIDGVPVSPEVVMNRDIVRGIELLDKVSFVAPKLSSRNAASFCKKVLFLKEWIPEDKIVGLLNNWDYLVSDFQCDPENIPFPKIALAESVVVSWD